MYCQEDDAWTVTLRSMENSHPTQWVYERYYLSIPFSEERKHLIHYISETLLQTEIPPSILFKSVLLFDRYETYLVIPLLGKTLTVTVCVNRFMRQNDNYARFNRLQTMLCSVGIVTKLFAVNKRKRLYLSALTKNCGNNFTASALWNLEFTILAAFSDVNVPSPLDFLRHILQVLHTKVPDIMDLVFFRAEYILVGALSTTLIDIHPRRAAVAAFYKALEYSGASPTINQFMFEKTGEQKLDVLKAVGILVRTFNRVERSTVVKKKYHKACMEVKL